MKKLILTSPSFSGEVHMLYGTNHHLLMIDMQAAELTDDQIEHMKKLAPVIFENKERFRIAFNSKTLMVTEADYEITFDMFWDKYGVKRNRDRSEKIWKKLSEADKNKAFFGLWPYFRFLALNSWRSKMEPDTYLKNKAWENDWK